ncbi:MAG TPA: RsmB/NOP family class I SAM-dependent RNA methyltransferase [Burkholderiales bacterium]|jgi:16S rRNA (cytosine967-C5)-methyltransferase|nr:RsmB/NOP family class I SAM-dependent RNA methyltransferase [Burkholderiales bacterium]
MTGGPKLTIFVFEHAIRALSGILSSSVAADKGLSEYFRENPKLGHADRGVVAETVYAVLRHKRSLGAAADSEYPRELALAALARVRGMNLKQLEHLLRPKETELIQKIKGWKAEEAPPAVRNDLPDWLWDSLAAARGEEGAEALARGLKQAAPLDLRVNLMKNTREEALTQLKAGEIEGAATRYSPHGIRLAGKPVLQRNALFLAGGVEVQDEGSQLLAELMAPKRGEMVIDFCAGAGGKTLALGALMRSSGRLYALDVAAGRLAKLKPRLSRSGLSNVHPLRIESENDIKVKRMAGKADRVLVDAPCSGLGTVRRNPDLKWRHDPSDIAELAVKQAAILVAAARLVKPGGRLVYATCSLLREENRAVVDAFLAAHPEFAEIDAVEVLAKRGIVIESAAAPALELLPQVHGTDGFFACVMERKVAPATAAAPASE